MSSDNPADSNRKSEQAAQSAQELAAALKRLNSAIDTLNKAVDQNAGASSSEYNSDEQVQRMSQDRSRLAKELDEAHARANALKEANSEVSKRLVGAMEMVRNAMEQQN